MASWTDWDDGPEWKVPRPVWQLAFGLCILVGCLPGWIVVSEMDQVRNATNYYVDAGLLHSFALTFTGIIYFRSVIAGTFGAVKWLFGPIPGRRRDRQSVDEGPQHPK